VIAVDHDPGRSWAGHCRAASALLHDNSDRNGEAASWDTIGYIHHQRGEFDQAIECYRHSLAMLR
jgi:tetratricopeptide (TPR) repeat protein